MIPRYVREIRARRASANSPGDERTPEQVGARAPTTCTLVAGSANPIPDGPSLFTSEALDEIEGGPPTPRVPIFSTGKAPR